MSSIKITTLLSYLKIFSFTLNQVPVALHMDLRSLADRLTPVDIIANFRIKTISDGLVTKRFISVKGHREMDYRGNLQIGLCVSDCALCEEYQHLDPGYVGSALSIVRF